MKKQFVINGKDDPQLAQTRPFGLRRPCLCACDLREGKKGAGYLHGIKNGTGVFIWIEKEEVFQALRQFVPILY